jgi:ligand-binding sensor domain-containing protein
MSIFRKYLMLVAFWSLQLLGLQGQTNSFVKIAPPSILAFSLIYGIAQDPQGYMWIIANQCLCRYDGYEFIIYRNHPTDPNSMAGHRSECIYASKNGFIWVGHFSEGLDRLDPQTGIFTHYRNDKKNLSSISCDSILSIVEDHQGHIWVGTRSGLNKLDTKTGAFTRYLHDAKDPQSITNGHIRVVYEDHSGTIWVGTGTPWRGDNSPIDGGGLNKFDSKTGKFFHYRHDPKDPHSLIDNRVNAICEDSRGVFWVGTAGDGLHTMDRATGKFERHLFDPANPNKLSRSIVKYARWTDDYITFIKEDMTGSIWIGTFASLLSRYNPITQKTERLPPISANSNAPDFFTSYFQACTSSDGEVWFATFGGSLYKFDPITTSVPYYQWSSQTQCFLKDTDNTLWIGTSTGLFSIEKSNQKMPRVFHHEEHKKTSISGDNIHCVYQDKENNLWVGTDSGLNRFNFSTATFTSFRNMPKNDNSISSDKIYSIFEDYEGVLWIGTADGLNKMYPRTGTFKRFLYDPTDANGISFRFVKCMLEDKHKILWLGAWDGGGINAFDRAKGTFKHYLGGSFVTSIVEDSKGIIWAGTSTSIQKYNSEKDIFYKYEDPLIGDFCVNSIVEDNQNNLWFNSLAGLTRINPSGSESITYPVTESLNFNDFLTYSSYKDKDGRLFFSTEFGFYLFQPQDLPSKEKAPSVILTAFKQGNTLLQISNKEDDLNKNLNKKKEIILNHTQNTFSFDFAVIHYKNPADNKCFYKLENYDSNWSYVARERTARYFNVQPGKYVFKVKAFGSNGVSSEKSIVIDIKSPWWSNWLIRAGFILCIVLLIFGLIRWRLNLKFRAQLERSNKEKQIAELKHEALELEMKSLRSQMNPHFIFNSLNSINLFILQNNPSLAAEYLTKFSRLMRMILQNSQATLITLENELESLTLYLELEALRFDDHFKYKISVSNSIDSEGLKVPPLTIQPYVENAIWHGLMHKQDRGLLEIEVLEDSNQLIFIIRDDGIGRKEAAALRSKSATKYKSMGVRITGDRIAMLQNDDDYESSVVINDLVSSDGRASGTEVIIKIPIIYD